MFADWYNHVLKKFKKTAENVPELILQSHHLNSNPQLHRRRDCSIKEDNNHSEFKLRYLDLINRL